MGSAKNEMMRLQDMQGPATEAALKAGAVKACEFHSDTILGCDDSDAERRAYAIGTNMVKSSEIDGAREEFMDAIKTVISEAMDACPSCARWREDD